MLANNKILSQMTKAEVVNEISERTGVERAVVQETVESFFNVIKGSLVKGENVYFRGFGSFILQRRAQKIARNISKNTQITIPAHNIPKFKPSKSFVAKIKGRN